MAIPHKSARLIACVVVLAVIPIGLVARSHRAEADANTLLGFLATYTGDFLWPIMFFFIGRFWFPAARSYKIFAVTLALTLTLEFGQLWQPPTLQWLRNQPIVGFLLGNSFVWSDVLCCLVGGCVALAVDSIRVCCEAESTSPNSEMLG